MKKTWVLIIAFTLLSVCSVTYADESKITVQVNSDIISFDTDPVIIWGRTYVPIRNVCEKLGADVYWDNEWQAVYIVKNAVKLRLKINSNILIAVHCNTAEEFVDSIPNNTIEMDISPIIYNNRTLIPVRPICEALGATVEWDNTTSTVIISCGEELLSNVNSDKNFFENISKCLQAQEYKKVIGDINFVDADNNIVLSKAHISGVRVCNDEDYGYYIDITLTSEGQTRFTEATERISNLAENNYISILLHGDTISQPRISGRIESESVIITGAFSKEDATALADKIAGW